MLRGAGWAYSLVEAHLGLHGPPCGSKPGRLSTRSRCWTWPRARKLVSRKLAGERTGRRDTSLTGFAVFKYTQRTLTPCHIVGSLSFSLSVWVFCSPKLCQTRLCVQGRCINKSCFRCLHETQLCYQTPNLQRGQSRDFKAL